VFRINCYLQSPKSQPIKVPASPGDASEQSALSSPSESGDKTAMPPATSADCDQSSMDQNHTKPLSDSGIEDGQSKSKKKGDGLMINVPEDWKENL